MQQNIHIQFFLLVEIGCTKIVELNVHCCGHSTGERCMLNLFNILEDRGLTSLTANIPEVLFTAKPLMDICNTLPDDMSVKPIILLL